MSKGPEKQKGERPGFISPNSYFCLGKEINGRKAANQADVLLFSHLDKDGARKNKHQPAATAAALRATK